MPAQRFVREIPFRLCREHLRLAQIDDPDVVDGEGLLAFVGFGWLGEIQTEQDDLLLFVPKGIHVVFVPCPIAEDPERRLFARREAAVLRLRSIRPENVAGATVVRFDPHLDPLIRCRRDLELWTTDEGIPIHDPAA